MWLCICLCLCLCDDHCACWCHLLTRVCSLLPRTPQRANDTELARLEEEHQALVEREKQEAQRRLAAQRQHLAAQQEEMRKAMMEEAQTQTKEVADAIMQEFDHNQEKVMSALKQEKKRQADNLQLKLAKRAARLRERKERELAEKLRLSAEEAKKQMADVEAAVKRRVTAAGHSHNVNTKKAAAIGQLTVLRVMSSRRLSTGAGQLARPSSARVPPLSGDIDTLRKVKSFAETGSLTGRSRSPRSVPQRSQSIASGLRTGRRLSGPSVEGSILEGDEGHHTHRHHHHRHHHHHHHRRRSVSPRGAPPMASAVNSRLDAIETLLARIAEAQGKTQAAGASTPLAPSAPTTPPPSDLATYQDDKESALADSATLETLPVASLSFREAKRHAFGQRLLAAMGLGGLHLQPASALPPPEAGTQGPYSKSFMYDLGTRTLYVHAQRFASGGELMDVLVHAAAFVKTAPERPYNANAQGFAMQLHLALRMCGQELFSQVGKSGAAASGSVEPLS